MKKFTHLVTENSGIKFKLGLDVHGVIDSMPDIFSFLSQAIINNGGEVHIVTGCRWDKNLEKQLTDFGIKWTHKFSVYDYLKESDAEIIGKVQFPDGTIQKKFKNEDWDSVKAKYCKENGIDLHIDDTLIYNDFFSTPFARLWSHNGKPKYTNKDIRHID
jgi:hypothetical protein